MKKITIEVSEDTAELLKVAIEDTIKVYGKLVTACLRQKIADAATPIMSKIKALEGVANQLKGKQ